jgi:dolichol kinase
MMRCASHRRFLGVPVCLFFQLIFELMQSLCLRYIVDNLENNGSTHEGYLWGMGFVLSTLFFFISTHATFFSALSGGQDLRIATIGVLYRKSLSISK